ncbi:hypothetical protein ABWK22_02765 [Gottfriedia acidiceleris]|uniref:hypothetical protein n=1 Tax=Gottfriedia acidiceleris TaxID=371036 RepID=UPI0033991FD7
MNKREIKSLEVKIEEVTGLRNVEIVVPNVVQMVAEPTMDIKMLELENKTNALRNRKSVRELRQERKVQAKERLFNKVSSLIENTAITVENIVGKVEDPKTLIKKMKGFNPVEAVVNFFTEEIDDEQGYEIEVPYYHHKLDTTKDGNVTYLNKDFIGLK